MKPYFFSMLALLLAACGKEQQPAPTQPAPLYALPQGNAPVDDSIMAFHRQHQTYVLYKFTQSDYAHDFSHLMRDSAFGADPAYVDTVFRFFKRQALAFYPPGFIAKTLPMKVLIASFIGSNGVPSQPGVASTSGMLAMGWANDAFLASTTAQLKQLRASLHRAYFSRLINTGYINFPPEFVALTPATGYSTATTPAAYETRLRTQGVIAKEVIVDMSSDFMAFVELAVANTAAQLETDWFIATRDRSGLVRKKYNVIMDYLKGVHGIDLKAIGELP